MRALVLSIARWAKLVSVELMSWALREAPVKSKADLLVLIVLCDEDRNRGAGAYISLATIASRARTSPRGAQNSLKNLRAIEVVEAEWRPGKTTVYRVRATPVAQCAPVAECAPQSATQTPADSYANPGSPVRPNRKKPSKAVGRANAPHPDFSEYDEKVIG